MATGNGWTPQPGDRAPDLTLHDQTGTPVRPGDYWRGAPSGAALVFLRHFG